MSWGPLWPWGFDPTEWLATIDYGGCAFDFGRPDEIPAKIQTHADVTSLAAASLALDYLCLRAHKLPVKNRVPR